MATFRIEFGQRSIKTGLCAVRILITMPNKTTKESDLKRHSLRFKINPEKQWDAKNNRVKNHPYQAIYNEQIAKKLYECERLSKNDEVTTAAQMQRRLAGFTGEPQTLYNALIEAYNDKDAAGKPNTADGYKTAAVTVKRILKDIHVADFDHDALESLVRGLQKEKKMPGTINQYLRSIRPIIRKAFKKGETKVNPFDGHSLPTYDAPVEILTDKEIESLETAHLDYKLGLARDIFMFCRYQAGMRIGDALTLKPETMRDLILTTTMGKSKDTREMKVAKKSLAIVERYKGGELVFPCIKSIEGLTPRELQGKIKSVVSGLNKDLKKVAKICNVKARLHPHGARHSFGDVVDDINDLQHAFGHESAKTTAIYKKKRNIKIPDYLIDKASGEG